MKAREEQIESNKQVMMSTWWLGDLSDEGEVTNLMPPPPPSVF